ncbi:Rieske 2Fe-2S domain-containing protein [Bradyrhizobium sp. WSM 1704]|uniref:Rieske 2Fe-2S domain-containing protein n=1 Tax=Bradyrhizobium semiaridum TaxID=2821404 RepID=UPI001CE2D207|nr:Rieske 2Fe-2S domain-containing protein [Bradyrhizobium semiaridum]MCA6121301.1 Rieske 2Fe-2S domain-containing protein [Bradyrhizobium semiaridum]
MVTREENELLCRVTGNAPMGRMLRQHYWLPAVLSVRVRKGEAPVRVKLFGRNFVAFRSKDGTVGFLDEACPHRGASLALARVDDCSLTCLFHGWKISASGEVLDVPNEPNNPKEFAKTVKAKSYPVREGAGLIWVWLGEGKAPPAPDFEWMDLPPDQVYAAGIELNANWLQGVEATIDSSHVALLHQSWTATSSSDFGATRVNTEVGYEFEKKPYGFRAAALRTAPDGSRLARVTEFVMPYYGLIAPIYSGQQQDRTAIIAVPIDDENLIQWYIYYNPEKPVDSWRKVQRANQWPMAGGLPGDRSTNWGQNRQIMDAGNSTGFHEIVIEDFVVMVSMGPIVDRSQEYLCSADQAIVRVRRQLLDEVRGFMAGKPPKSGQSETMSYKDIRAVGGRLASASEDWRQIPR